MFSFSIACTVLFSLPMGQEFICYFRFLVVLDKHLIVSLFVLDKMDKSYVCLYVLSVCVHELLCLSRVLCLLLCM